MLRSFLLSIVAGGFRLLRNPARLIAPRASHASPPAPDRVGGRPPLTPEQQAVVDRTSADLRAAFFYPDGSRVMANETRTPEEIQQQEKNGR